MSIDSRNPGLIAKAISGALGAAAVAAITANQDGRVDGAEWAGIASALIVGLGVWWATNLPEGWRKYAKAGTAVLLTVLAALGTALADGDGITTNELLTMLLAIVNGVNVAVTPNASDSAGVLQGDPEPPLGEHHDLAAYYDRDNPGGGVDPDMPNGHGPLNRLSPFVARRIRRNPTTA